MNAKQLALPAILAGGMMTLVWLGGEGTAQEITPVEVVNLPEVQTVDGEVTIGEPVPHAKFVRLEHVIVAPVGRSDTTSLESAGLVDVAGFTHAVLSLRGESQGKLGRDGAVGAILVPDQEPIARTFLEAGQLQFALEVQATALRQDGGYFASPSVRESVAFPRYRVLLFNETDRSAEVDVYLYMTH